MQGNFTKKKKDKSSKKITKLKGNIEVSVNIGNTQTGRGLKVSNSLCKI